MFGVPPSEVPSCGIPRHTYELTMSAPVANCAFALETVKTIIDKIATNLIILIIVIF
jgi:hypothetical protein